MFSLVYTSRATSPMLRDDLLGLLRPSRAHNSAARLTGLLLYRDRTFVQLLEGHQERVESLYASIRRDERHTDVTTVVAHDVPDRQFPRWSMAFSNLDAEPIRTPGWDDLLDRPEDDRAGADASFVRELLDMFSTPRGASSGGRTL